ncbi:AAC-rich mRNA clone AAC4 protein-like [Ptychodera flava]|uniref:AAC-rich mRNA clone AAC4 protein-like n=1 Tax=Ptychodera flava TaxID=63121 RepID=UPI00396A24D6
MNISEGGVIRCDYEARRQFTEMNLSEQAKRLWTTPNAGGNSVESEVLSFELLKRCFRACLLKTEMEVIYFPYGGSITDYTCQMFQTKLGVSVTRAMKFKGHYEMEDAEKLLRKKLKGVNMASSNSLEGWSKQILHVWAASSHIADTVAEAYHRLPTDVASNTVVLITTASRQSTLFSNTVTDSTRGRA